MITETRPLVELTQEALRMLYQELGPINTVRFLNQFTTGFGNYTEERRAAIENQTLDEVLAEVFAYQARITARQSDSNKG